MDPRTDELRRVMAQRRLQLDGAIATLSRVSTRQLTIGHYVARHPWRYLLGACVVGVVLGLRHRTD